jgi:long-chain acyl-CoA synthetase
MNKIWPKSYPPGIPADIDPDTFSSLKQLFEQSCAQYRDRTAYVNLGAKLGYGQLDELSARFGAWLQKHAGLKKGDRVAIMLPNIMQYPVAMFGALRAGLVVVNTNPLYTPRELEHQLKDSGAKAVVILENFASVLQEVVARTAVRHVVVTAVGDMLGMPKSALVNFVVRRIHRKVPAFSLPEAMRFMEVLKAYAPRDLAPTEVGHEDIAYLQYTGGTTGVAKGAVLTHRNMVSNMVQARAWLSSGIRLGDHFNIITALPLYHIFSLTANCLVFSTWGACNVLITNPRDFPAFVKELKKYPFAFISGVNTLFNALLHTPGFDTVDFSQLKVSLGGGMAVQRSVAQRWKEVTGNVLTQAWGLTETSPAACINPLVGVEFNGSIGLPIPSTELSIQNDAGEQLAVEQIGELCVRGPQVMREYWKQPDETDKVLSPDGWLRTGDIGHMDENGFVYIQDRKKDMINVSGFNVYPNEVEEIAVSHPGVLEAAAVAQADEHSGEVVALFVVRKDPTLTAEALIAHCHGQLTGYKVPRHVYFRQELPKTNVGKILRRALRDELAPRQVST